MDSWEKRVTGLVETYSDMVFRLAFAYMKNIQDSEDAVQEVFLKLTEGNGKKFVSREHEKAWIIRVTINICKNKLKLYWNKNTSGLSAGEIPYTDTYESDNFVFQAVMELPEQYREIVHLYYYEGYNTAEIARLLNKRESSVRSALHRARTRLKSVLKEEYDFGQ